jgi:hypothetical protein
MERGFLLDISTLYATSKCVVVCNKFLFLWSDYSKISFHRAFHFLSSSHVSKNTTVMVDSEFWVKASGLNLVCG